MGVWSVMTGMMSRGELERSRDQQLAGDGLMCPGSSAAVIKRLEWSLQTAESADHPTDLVHLKRIIKVRMYVTSRSVNHEVSF